MGGYFFSRNISGEAFTKFGSQYSQGLGALGNASLNNGQTSTYSQISNNSYALFLQGTWHLAPQWNLTAGARETSEDELGTVHRPPFTGGQGAPPPTLGPYDGNFLNHEWTPSWLLSLDYQMDETTLLYAARSYGAKAGGFNPTVPPLSSGVFLPIETLRVKPERTTDYEVGLKSQWLARRLTFNLNAYWQAVSDYQTSALQLLPNTERRLSITNVGGVDSRGWEAELVAKLVSGVRLVASVSYNEARYDKFTNGPAIQGSVALNQDLSGRQLPLAPAWTSFLGLRFDQELESGVTGFLDGEMAHKSGYYGYFDNSEFSRVSAGITVNLQAGVTIDRAEIAIWVRNISDERSFAPVFPAATGAGGYFATPKEPRSVGVTLHYRLDERPPGN